MTEVMKPQEDMEVQMYFLNKTDLWNTTKPYVLQYYPKEDFPRHNLQHLPCTTKVHDMRARNPPVSIDAEGFEYHHVETKMEYSDFNDPKKVENIYCRELEKFFLEALGAKHVRALDYQIRRRSVEFPYFGGKLPPRPQPSLITHVDVTPNAAKEIVHQLYGGAAPEILKSRFQVVTVWRVLRVPVQDWPLAVCDATSVAKTDLVPTDIIYPKYITENCLLHYNKNQRWYWLGNQKSNEVLVFKAMDSDAPTTWPCPHGAFPLPNQGDETSRESIDVRLLVMYADMEYPPCEPWTDNLNV